MHPASFSPTVSALAGRSLLLLLLVVLTTGDVRGQGFGGFTPEVQEALQRAQRGALERAISGDAVPLEGAIDPEAYTVGPGDVFVISIGTALPTDFSATVSADGLLVVPSVGSFEVAGRSLAEARTLVLAGIRRSFRNVNAEVALERPRQFYVHVAGTVAQPGRHALDPIARVEDALKAAMEGTSPVLILQELRRAEALTGEPTFLPALRSVEVRHRDGTTETVDLWRYYTSGDLRFNPYVRDGDALHVPAFRDDLDAVTVEGEIANAGSYDFREGDTALDLLTIAAGSRTIEDLGSVRLVRRGAGPPVTLDPLALASGQGDNPALHPGDRLLVMPPNLGAGVASVAGYVNYPGSYPIRAGVTTLRDLVEMAGGLRPDALLRGAYLERRGTTRRALYNPDQPTPFRAPPLGVEANPQAVAFALEAEVNALTRNSDLGFTGRQFYGRELLQPQRVSVDVTAALAGSGTVPLQDGDRLVIPRDPHAVLVVGQVGRPGYVPFQPGRRAEDYIEAAGGRGTQAAAVYVRDAATGQIAPATNAPLDSGDYVFVDRVGVGSTAEVQGLVLQERNLDLQQRNLDQQRRMQYFQVGLSVVSTVAAFVTTYIALTRE